MTTDSALAEPAAEPVVVDREANRYKMIVGTRIDEWYDLLEYWQIDDGAVAALQLLANHSPYGNELANGILMKLLKKKEENQPLSNPSAFTFAAVKTNRKKIDPSHD